MSVVESVVKFHEGEPPRNGRTYVLKFKDGTLCSGSYRNGRMGEPQQNEAYWRCDCCGRMAMPIAWARRTVNLFEAENV